MQILLPDSDLALLRRPHLHTTTSHPPCSPPASPPPPSPPPPPPPPPRVVPSRSPRVRSQPQRVAQIHPRLPPLPGPTPGCVVFWTHLPLGRLGRVTRVEQVTRGLQPPDTRVSRPPPAWLGMVTARLSPG